MRLVLDTNVAISGMLWRGTPSRLIYAAAHGRVELATSPTLLVELECVLGRRKLAGPLKVRGVSARDVLQSYAALIRLYTPDFVEPVIHRDPDDDEVLAAALAADADLIVSGDTDLLDLGWYRDIEIVTASTAVQRCNLKT